MARREGAELRLEDAPAGTRSAATPRSSTSRTRSRVPLRRCAAERRRGRRLGLRGLGVRGSRWAAPPRRGSHGSLVAGDSLVPVMTVGLEAPCRQHRRRRPRRARALRCPGSLVRGTDRGMSGIPVGEFERRRARMVEHQLRRRGISDERVLAAMSRAPREELVPPEIADVAYEDAALPIGEGQTICSRSSWPRCASCSGSTAPRTSSTWARVGVRGRRPRRAGQASSRWAHRGARRSRPARPRPHGPRGCRGARRRRKPRHARLPGPFDAISVAAATDHVPAGALRAAHGGRSDGAAHGGRGGQRLVRVVRTPDGPEVTASLACRFVPLVEG